ncbi:nucleolar protein 6 [Tanacetum coccineum]
MATTITTAATADGITDTLTLKITELMKEVQLDYSSQTTTFVNDVVSSIQNVINNIPDNLLVNADLAPKFVRDIGADKVKFKFKKPKAVEIGGSYAIQCVVKPDVNVDVYVRLPKECFHEKDYLNYRYHGKRCLYLCIIKKYLDSSTIAEKVEWSSFHNEARKPILVVHPVAKSAGLPGFTVRLIPTADSLFDVKKLNTERNNLHLLSQGVSEATPMYNHSILEDMFMEHGSEFVKKAFIGWKALGEALILLKVWARQRSSLHTYDSLNGYLISTIMAYLASESSKARINKAMTVTQIFRTTLDFMANSKLWGGGIFFEPQGGNNMSNEERKRFVKCFPAVICDLSAHFNLAYRMTKCGLIELQEEAALGLRCIDKCREGGFVELFLTKIDFPAKFDYCMRLNLKGKAEVSAQGFCLDNECWRLYENKVHSSLQQGLGDRVKCVRVIWKNTTSTSSVNDGLSVLDKEPVIVGISVSLPEAFDEYTRGPLYGNKEEALKFRKFWGDKAELYQFKSGTRECVLWQCKPAKRYLIIKWVSEYVLKRHLSLTEEKIVHVVDQLDFSLVPDGADLASDGSLLESFNTLSKGLRNLQDIPLGISSVQPLDSAFRHTSVFPPRPHPLANGTKDGNKINSTCIQSLELEGSGHWPMDDMAIEKTKAAFLLRIGECLQKQHGIKYCPSEEGVDVFLSGYVYRLKILHERGLDLLNGQAESYQVKRVSPTDKYLFLRSQHSSMINGLSGRYPLYGPVVQLAKRWVAAHLFSASFMEEAIELVVAYIFQKSLPFSAPCSRISGFMRFLRLVSEHDWMFTPMIVDINEDMTPKDEKEINEKFSLSRKAYDEGKGNVTSAMYLATAYDKGSEAWTSSSPSQSELKRLAVYAKSSSNLLTKLIVQGQMDSYGWECVFRTPLNNYDAIILLHRDKLSHPERLLFPSEFSQGKLVVQGNASKSFQPFLLTNGVNGSTKNLRDQLYLNFDPLTCYVKDLEAMANGWMQNAFPNAFKLWYDCFGGDAIGLTWEKENLKKRRREEDGDVKENVTNTLKDIGKVGKGFVKSVYLLKVPNSRNPSSWIFTAMGLLSIIRKIKRKEKEMRILMVGLDNSGKTTIVLKINGEDTSVISPTLGFNIKTMTYDKYTLNIWDVGGQKTIRSYWRNYFEQTDGLVWVVDSSDLRRLDDCKYELDNLLKEERLSGASLLVFANKQDIQGALSPDEIAKVLNLDAMDKTRHWRIVGCSAYTGDGLLEGFDWLVQDIASRIYVLD